MTTKQIADRLVELCRKGDFDTAQKELYADDAISIEAQAMGPFQKETKGLAGIQEKGKVFMGLVEETHNLVISDPVVADHSFCISMLMDATMKGMGRNSSTELCVYKVKDGKIVSEEFIM